MITPRIREVHPFPEWTSDLLDDDLAQDYSAIVEYGAADIPKMLNMQARVVEKMSDDEIKIGLRRFVQSRDSWTQIERAASEPVRKSINYELFEMGDPRSVKGRPTLFVEEILEEPRIEDQKVVCEVRFGCTADLSPLPSAVASVVASVWVEAGRKKKKAKAEKPAPSEFPITTEMLDRKLRDMLPYLP